MEHNLCQKVWKSRLQNLGIIPTYSSIRNPNSNPSERWMKEIGRLLRTYCYEKHTSWVLVIPQLENCLNNIPNSSTSLTPASILGCNEVYSKLFPAIKNYCESPKRPTKQEIEQFVLKQLYKNADKRKKQQKNKTFELEIGDLVLLKTNTLSKAEEGVIHKLCLLYDGPYKIIEKKNTNAYLLRHVYEEKSGVYNVRNIKPFI